MQINFEKKYLIGSALFLILSLLIFFFFYKKIGEIKVATIDTEIALQNEILTQEKTKNLDFLMKSIEKEKNSFEKHFVTKADIVTFLNTIENLSSSVGASANILTVDDSKDVPELSLSISAEGSFEAIYKFLLLLENSQYEIQVDMLDIKKGGSGQSEGSISNWIADFKIKLLTFSR